MSSAIMRKAVLQATALATLSYIISHHLHSKAVSPLVSAFFDTLLENATSIDWDAGTITTSSPDSEAGSPSPIFDFYIAQLPRFVLCTILVQPLYYYWHIWLERTFPARQRGSEPAKRRTSISWCYTLLKWMLHLGIGRPLTNTLFLVCSNAVGVKSSASTLDTFGEIVIFAYTETWLSIQPSAALLAFVVVPAHQRIVFLAGMELLTTTFLGLVMGKLIPWLLRLQFVQETMRAVAGAFLEILRNETDTSQAATEHTFLNTDNRIAGAAEPPW